MEGTQYRNYSLELQPGAKLFVYTDGVPEASNKDNALFGTDRMLEALNRQPEAGPEQLLRNVRQAVDLFVQDAEQFDDLTMLCVEYKGGSMTEQNGLEPRAETDAPQPETTDSRSSSGEELVLPARVENLERVQRFVADRLGEDCSPKTRMQLDLAVEEIFVNIASYAYAPGEGQAAIRVEHSESPASVTLVFRDSGVPYNPLAREDPDVEVLAGERQIGGLGIFLTKQVMDELHYEHTDGQNVLTMKKRL
jgi:sigma-B regulation protein RsbU (phosphoserine phosphatase)